MLWTSVALALVIFLFACHDVDADAQVCLTLADGIGKVIFRGQHTDWLEIQIMNVAAQYLTHQMG